MYSSIKTHGEAHTELEFQNGNLHVFANEQVFYGMDYKVFEMASNNLRIPRNIHMSYTPDAHPGKGTCIGTTAVWSMEDGFISPSIVGVDIGCGMRVHLTPLHKDDLKGIDIKRKLVEAIEEFVPTHERTNSNYPDIDLRSVISGGINGLPYKYRGAFMGATSKVESSMFPYDLDYLSQLPKDIFERSAGQMGTLGGGNHFIEVQYLNIEDNELASKWGMFDGQVVVMIHSGSRAWGATLGKKFTKEFKDTMRGWGISNPDPDLIYAPINSKDGQTYYHLMHSALNFAVANRHMIAYGVQKGFRKLFGEDFEMSVLYDLMHNYALKEYHRNRSLLVHRKGATRALPAGHFLNMPAYKETGHPALIPGSMGTSSYIMVGKEEGVKNFYSICHGAGRLRSRRATKELVKVDEFASTLRVGEDDEIAVNHKTLESIIDESPQAYKDVDQIIDSVVKADLASVVAQCKPLAVIKGT